MGCGKAAEQYRRTWEEEANDAVDRGEDPDLKRWDALRKDATNCLDLAVEICPELESKIRARFRPISGFEDRQDELAACNARSIGWSARFSLAFGKVTSLLRGCRTLTR